LTEAGAAAAAAAALTEVGAAAAAAAVDDAAAAAALTEAGAAAAACSTRKMRCACFHCSVHQKQHCPYLMTILEEEVSKTLEMFAFFAEYHTFVECAL
jgi:hypothetical protein